MSKKLAIKGHPTRGNEVIEILKMMGGEAIRAKGNDETAIYVIPVNGIIDVRYTYEKRIDNYAIFTLEEFLEKYPFKVGDIIKFHNGMAEEITKMKWDEELGDIIYTSVSGWTRPCYVPKNTNNKTNMKTDCKKCGLHFGSIQCFDKDCPNNTPKNKEEKKINQMSLVNCDLDEIEIVLGDKFELKIEDGKYYAVRKRLKYPKTYNECYDILSCFNFTDVEQYNFENDWRLTIKDKNYGNLMNTFVKLLICRDAYWKIAGEQMGLDKYWKPDWKNAKQKKYCIYSNEDYITKCVLYYANAILSFPTLEMRDVFYENFKDLIEQCKELL